MDRSALADDLKQNVDETTVVEVLLELVILGGLQNSFHACEASLVVSVLLDHLNEIHVCLHGVDSVWDEVHQVAEDSESMNLQLLLLRRLPATELRVL